jgi:hypothetical protein
VLDLPRDLYYGFYAASVITFTAARMSYQEPCEHVDRYRNVPVKE